MVSTAPRPGTDGAGVVRAVGAGVTGFQPGETVLVTGAAGGVGLAAVDFAHHLGARVIAVVGLDDRLAVVRQCGADPTVNGRTENLPLLKNYAAVGVFAGACGLM